MSMKATEFGLELDDRAAGALSEELKQLESEGWLFESADASLELRMRRAAGWQHESFELEEYRVSSVHRSMSTGEAGGALVTTEASVSLRVGNEFLSSVGEGNGPVNALDDAVRRALDGRFPSLARIHLTDFKVRVVDGGAATGAVVRVLIDSTDGERVWTTVGVDSNVIEAAWQALIDSLQFGLLHAGG
jgi:2-isopropylmalate synthase